MASSEIEFLYNQYKETRPQSEMSLEKFDTFMLFFPCLIVVASDGIIDQEEWMYIRYLAKFVSDVYKEELTADELVALEDTIFSDLEFLAKHLDQWQKRFLDALKAHLENQPDLKIEITEILFLFADASDGLSDDEKNAIKFLKNELDLDELEEDEF